MSALQLMRRLGLSETQTEEAWAVLQKEKLETVDALRHIWSHTSDGRWQALSLDSNVKDELMFGAKLQGGTLTRIWLWRVKA
ncbi:unnamed protein product [Symbiodinium necroappetens]|uniref:Uncharacterized protein n=1 Tax=Symbiodinium necroappetens TaxID=1628268 RepID=A0A813CIQ9_9DINO|nr:unnamed protein product [Symbiodinium necroappetens]